MDARLSRSGVVKTKLLWFSLILLVVWAMKRYYSAAGADDLWWILGPTARLAGGTAVGFVAEPGTGYLCRERMFLIGKSCAGLNFMIAAFAMLAFTLRRRVVSCASGAHVLAGCLLAAYAATVMVNAARIAIAMWLAAHPLTMSRLTPAQVHRLEGVIVYFVGLVLLHELIPGEHGVKYKFLRACTPLAFYYAVTLGLPLANGAGGVAFVQHALVVLAVPLMLMVLFCAAAVGRGRHLSPDTT